MKHGVLLALLLALGCMHVRAAPVDKDGPAEGSCSDPIALGQATEALTKINQDRQEGYVFKLHRLSNVHKTQHGDNGIVFYLTMDVVETNCSVHSQDWSKCAARDFSDVPVYGQCKAAIFANRVQRVERLYKYKCVVRPVPPVRVSAICPDCPSRTSVDGDEVKRAVSLSLDKFNKESGLANHFGVLKINRAKSGYIMSMGMYYHVEYTIKETTCPKSTEAVTAAKCPHMECEFAHTGLCKGTLYNGASPDSEPTVSVECEIYEPEAAEKEKKLHLLGGETDHSHTSTDSHGAGHDGPHKADAAHSHDHVHDHTKSHAHHDKTHTHAAGSEHHHAHDHEAGGHSHAHAHSHDHGHGHDHVHAHHAAAHNHTGDFPHQHHNYQHAGEHTHDHDHELALDHDHKHGHLHEHEHHHHHHDHDHETTPHHHPEGSVRELPALGMPVTMPSFPDTPAGDVGVTLPAKPDPQIPGAMEPVIVAYPTSLSAECPAPTQSDDLVGKLFIEDPEFKASA